MYELPAESSSRKYGIYFVSAANVEPSEHEFLLGDKRFPIGEITIVAGAGGVGKGQFAAAHMAMASKGYNLNGVLAGKPVRSVFITAEDNASDVRARLDRSLFEAEMTRVMIQDKMLSLKYDLDLSGEFAKSDLENIIWETHTQLIYIDPIQAFVGEYTDLSRQNHVRRIMHTIATVAEENRCAIVLLMHLNKRQQIMSPADLLCGSSDIVNASRSALLLTNDFKDGDPDRRYLFHIKSNHARSAKTLELRIGSEGNRIVGECEVTQDDFVMAMNTRKTLRQSSDGQSFDKLFYDGVEQMIAEGKYQSTFNEFVERFAPGYDGRVKCILDEIAIKVEERLGYVIQLCTSGKCPVKIHGERGFRIIKLK